MFEDENKIVIVDSIMGSYKTTRMIELMKEHKDEYRFMYITPYLAEIERIKQHVSMVEPKAVRGSKLEHIRQLTKDGVNIISTHSLLGRFDIEIQNSIEVGEYILILDEVPTVVEEHHFNTLSDKEDFFNFYASIGEDGYVYWDETAHPVDSYKKGSKFYEEMILCINKNLIMVNDKLLMWELPVEIFKKFHRVVILTYLFEGSVQKPYFDLFDIVYSKYSVKDKQIVPYFETSKEEKDKIRNLINIIDKDSLNKIGDDYYALSSTWYKDNVELKGKNVYQDRLVKNLETFYRNYTTAKSDSAMWSTFKDFKSRLKGRGYTKGFIPFNIRATNLYINCYGLAYMLNVFPHTSLTMYFNKRSDNIKIDANMFALSTLIQWIWRSRLRNSMLEDSERKIDLYIPSSRMRNLLIKWLES